MYFMRPLRSMELSLNDPSCAYASRLTEQISPNDLRDKICDILFTAGATLDSESGWVRLLVALLHEYSSPESKWRPYLDLVPDYAELDLPMFWPEAERTRLLDNTLSRRIGSDVSNIKKEFEDIVRPFLLRNKDVFSNNCDDLKLYMRLVAFVMAYSFTEPPPDDGSSEESDEEEDVSPPPYMVPVADILNHVTKNNARLNFEKDRLVMVATTDIPKGEEVFNTYGELGNDRLLQMYGFAEPHQHNLHHTTVDVDLVELKTYLNNRPESDQNIVAKRMKIATDYMRENTGSSEVLFTTNGIYPEEHVNCFFKIIACDELELASIEDNLEEGWGTEADSDDLSFSIEDIPELPSLVKSCLHWLANEKLKSLPLSDEQARSMGQEAEVRLRSPGLDVTHTLWARRELYSTRVTLSQFMILDTVLRACFSD